MLFDTCVFIDYFRSDNADARRYVEDVITQKIPGYCSTITEVEMWSGVRNRREATALEILLSRFTTISVNSGIAKTTGGLLNRMSAAQRKSHFADALIAATALEIGQTVLTADGRSQRVFGHRADYLVYHR